MRQLYYYGYHKRLGSRFLIDKGGNRVRPPRKDRALEFISLGLFDGLFAPRIAPMELYAATVSRLPGLGFDVLAWWDQSVDLRSESDSLIFVSRDEYGDTDRATILSLAMEQFPWVFSRLPVSLKWWEPTKLL